LEHSFPRQFPHRATAATEKRFRTERMKYRHEIEGVYTAGISPFRWSADFIILRFPRIVAVPLCPRERYNAGMTQQLARARVIFSGSVTAGLINFLGASYPCDPGLALAPSRGTRPRMLGCNALSGAWSSRQCGSWLSVGSPHSNGRDALFLLTDPQALLNP
jgi:hypothetical protein